MASISKRGNTYRITVSNGRAADGTQIRETATIVPDPTTTEHQNKKSPGEIRLRIRGAGEKRKIPEG